MSNQITLFKEYCAVRVGLHSLFDQITAADPELAPFVDAEETIRVMLADFFYGDIVQPTGKKVLLGDRTIAFKDHATRDIQKPNINDSLIAIADVFWNLSDYILDSVLKASLTYTHSPQHCFYQYIPAEKTMVVYVPVLEGVEKPTSLPIQMSAVVIACYRTLPTYLKTVFNDFVDSSKRQVLQQNTTVVGLESI